jgi:3D-(3,5/4)-trihydroxycyclohexane-1,2-dione acylhydrolase (decyclizing)
LTLASISRNRSSVLHWFSVSTTHYRAARNGGPILDTPDGHGLATASDPLPVDFAANAASLGAQVIQAQTIAELRDALADSAADEGPVVIYVEVDRYDGVPGFEGWWEVPVAETSEDPPVRSARESYEQARRRQRLYLETP